MRIGWLVRNNYSWDSEDDKEDWTFIDGEDYVPSYYSEKKMIVYDFVENVDD